MNLLRDSLEVGRQAYAAAKQQTDDLARTRAGRMLAAGDSAGAARSAYEGGLLDEGMAIQDRGMQAEQQQYDRARQSKADDLAEQQRKAGALIKVAQGLKRLPTPEARHAALQRIAPVFQSVGIDPAPFLALTPDQLTNENLDVFSGEVANRVKVLNTSGGVVAVDTDALSRDMNDPSASRVIYQDPQASEYRAAQIDATQARAEASRAQAAKARRPPAGRAAAPAQSGVPAGFVLD